MKPKELRELRGRIGTSGARVCFNWGYHDAAHDGENSGEYRIVAEQDGPMYVKPSQGDYFHGYQAGKADYQAGLYRRNSERAWNRYFGKLDRETKVRVWAYEFWAEMHTFQVKFGNGYWLREGEIRATGLVGFLPEPEELAKWGINLAEVRELVRRTYGTVSF